MCVIVCSVLYACAFECLLTLSGHRARGVQIGACLRASVCAHGVSVRAHSFAAERLARPGVMSDARGGFLPTSPLACWLANGLLSGLADRLAGSQWLLLPYLVAEGGGWWRRVVDGGAPVLCLHAGSGGQSARVPWSKHRSLKDSKRMSESLLHSHQLDGLGKIHRERV